MSKIEEILYNNLPDESAKHINEVSFLPEWIMDAMKEYAEYYHKEKSIINYPLRKK